MRRCWRGEGSWKAQEANVLRGTLAKSERQGLPEGHLMWPEAAPDADRRVTTRCTRACPAEGPVGLRPESQGSSANNAHSGEASKPALHKLTTGEAKEARRATRRA